MGKPSLVIDEAHNLPSRAMDYYSPALSSVVLEKMRDEMRKLPPRFRSDAEELLDGCLRAVASCRQGENAKPLRIDPPVERFAEQDAGLRAFLSRYLDSDLEIEHQDPVLRLSFYWSAFTETLEYVVDPEREEAARSGSPAAMPRPC